MEAPRTEGDFSNETVASLDVLCDDSRCDDDARAKVDPPELDKPKLGLAGGDPNGVGAVLEVGGYAAAVAGVDAEALLDPYGVGDFEEVGG